MEFKKLLGRKIKQYRILRGYSQEKLAELLNISQRTLSGIECGNNFLTSQTLDKIFSVLDVSPEDLFFVEYLKTPKELVNELIKDIKSIEDDQIQLQTVYKVVKAILKV